MPAALARTRSLNAYIRLSETETSCGDLRTRSEECPGCRFATSSCRHRPDSESLPRSMSPFPRLHSPERECLLARFVLACPRCDGSAFTAAGVAVTCLAAISASSTFRCLQFRRFRVVFVTGAAVCWCRGSASCCWRSPWPCFDSVASVPVKAGVAKPSLLLRSVG